MPDDTRPAIQIKERHTRLLTILSFLVFLLALAYSPIDNATKEMFAQWGFWGSVGYAGAKTLQNITGKEKA